MKKTILKSVFALFATIILLTSCSKDDDPKPNNGTSLGTFNGNIQVSDDPQTQLGYIYNAKVSVTKNNSNATVKITGDLGIDREYTGIITSSNGSSVFITIDKQTKPTVKSAGQSLQIFNNELTIQIGVLNESVQVKTGPTATTPITISGKLSMIGTSLLKQ